MLTTHSHMNRLRLLSLSALSVALACGDAVNDPAERRGESTISISADVSATTAGLSVEITATDINPPIVQNIPIVANVASGTVTIPAGSQRTLTVRAFDTGAIETHRGSRTIDVVEGTNLEVTFTLEPLMGDVPIVVNTATYVVTLDATTIALAAAGTRQLSVTVTDATGVVSGAAVTWGSRNPVIASVDQTGRVTGGVLGTTSVVAQYRRSVAVVPVTVQAAAATTEVIVFSRAIGGASPDVYVMSPDGSGITQLTTVAGADIHAAWSSDGRRIAFMSERNDAREIFAMNPDGTGQTEITTGPSDRHPSWSPDGSRMLFMRGFDIWVTNADRTGAAAVIDLPEDVSEPDWSPDGTRIAFTWWVGGTNFFNRDIAVASIDGTGPTSLTRTDFAEEFPAWSPDGARIAFQTDRDGNFEIYVMNADGTGLLRLTNDPAFDGHPAWSPDGTRLVFTRGDPDGDLYVMNADGTGVVQLTSGTTEDDYADWVALPVGSGANQASR